MFKYDQHDQIHIEKIQGHDFPIENKSNAKNNTEFGMGDFVFWGYWDMGGINGGGVGEITPP